MVHSQPDRGLLAVFIRLFGTVLCLESDSQCWHCCTNRVKNAWLARDWNVTDRLEPVGSISYMDCPGTEPVFCGYEARPSWAMKRRQVGGSAGFRAQNCTSWYDIVTQKTAIKACEGEKPHACFFFYFLTEIAENSSSCFVHHMQRLRATSCSWECSW